MHLNKPTTWVTMFATAAISLATINVTPFPQAGASAPVSNPQPKTNISSVTQLSSAVQQNVANVVAQAVAERKMNASQAKDFQASFQKQVVISQRRLNQLSALQRRAGFDAAKAFGYSDEVANAVVTDPVAALVTPIKATAITGNSAQTTSVSPRTPGGGSGWSDGTGPVLAACSQEPCPHNARSSSNPYMGTDYSDLYGITLMKVRAYRDWSYDGAHIWSVSRWAPPGVSYSPLCVGCTFKVDYHDEYYYGHTINGYTAFVVYTNYTLKQCLDLWILGTVCHTNASQWSLHLHERGNLWYHY